MTFLGLELQDCIRSAVHRVSIRAMSAPEFTRDTDSMHELAAATMECTQSALRDILRAHNATAMPLARVPQELWDMAWSYLPMEDRICVSQVCHDWRVAALASPWLWRCVDFWTTQHSVQCECTRCDSDIDPGPYRTGATNIAAVEAILSRSAELPLSVTVEVLYWYINTHGLVQLALALRPHVARIVAISVETVDAFAISELFRKFSALPALRVLVCNSTAQVDITGIGFIPEDYDLQLPVLERLEIHGPIDCGDAAQPSALPSLRTLHCPFIQTHEFLQYLSAAPQIAHLEVSMVFDDSLDAESDAAYDRVRRSVAHIDRIDVHRIVTETACPALDMFDDTHRPYLSLNYADHSRLARGLEILLDVATPVELSVLEERGRIIISAVGGVPEITRKISYPCAGGNHVWVTEIARNIAPEVDRLVLDLRCLLDVARSGLRPYEHVRTIVLHVRPTCDFNSLATGWTQDTARTFPILETLRVEGTRDSNITIAAAALNSFIYYFMQTRQLGTLDVRHVTVDGDPSCLKENVMTLLLNGRSLPHIA